MPWLSGTTVLISPLAKYTLYTLLTFYNRVSRQYYFRSPNASEDIEMIPYIFSVPALVTH